MTPPQKNLYEKRFLDLSLFCAHSVIKKKILHHYFQRNYSSCEDIKEVNCLITR